MARDLFVGAPPGPLGPGNDPVGIAPPGPGRAPVGKAPPGGNAPVGIGAPLGCPPGTSGGVPV